MSIATSLKQFRSGFHPTFWVANGMELFERLAYYGQGTVLSIFLRDHLKFTEIEAGQLSSVFGGLIYALPILGGTLADKFGYRRAFSIAFFMLAVGYFLIGSTGMEAFESVYSGLPLFWVLVVILIFTAIGGSFIKPSVLGTVSVTSTPETKSLGYAVYYWLVNIGAAAGPAIAYFVRDDFGIEFVYVVSALSCGLMLVVNLLFYKEVASAGADLKESLSKKLYNLVMVLGNIRFIAFLLIFALYWIMFWQIFIVVPFFVKDNWPDAPFEIVQSAGAWSIILLQLAVNRLTKRLSPSAAMVAGFALSSLSWLIVALFPNIWTLTATIASFAIGEMTQAPRYYEYISDIAPPGQQGLFQGYAFLPIAIAWAIGGTLGGWMYTAFARESNNPQVIWFILFGIGATATLFMWLYTRFVVAQSPAHSKP